MTAPAVPIDPRARRAWDLPASLPAGALVVATDGTAVRILPDGRVEPVQPGGHPHGGIASDPCAGTTGQITNPQHKE